MSEEIKPLFLEDGNLRQMSPGFTIDSSMLNGSTVGRFNSQNSYKAGRVVLHDIGQGPAFYEAKEDLYPKAFHSGDWEPVGTAITGSQGNQGLDGSPGSDAKFLVVTADSHVFRYGSDGVLANPEQITITANMQNLGEGVLTWVAIGNGVDRTGTVDLFPSGEYACTVLGNKLIIPGEFFTTFVNVNQGAENWEDPVLTLTATQGNYQDTFRILKLKDGENSLTAFLSNSNHTTATGEKVYVDGNSDGVSDSPIVSGDPLASAGGVFRVFRGFLHLTPENSTVSYEVGDITPMGTDAETTPGAVATIDEDGVYVISSVSAETVTVTFKATVDEETVETVYTHTLIFRGVDGTSFLSGPAAPTTADGSDGDFWLDTSSITLYGPKRVADDPQWPLPGMNLTGAGVDTDGDGLVDAMVANGFLGHNRTIDRSLSCAATVNGLMIGEITIEAPNVFTIAEGGIIIIVGEQIGSAITPDSLGEFLSTLAVSGAWGDVANKPAEFPPESHTQSVASITGLQAALTELQRAAMQNRVFVSDQAPPFPGAEGDETRVGDIWVQWDPVD
jgi:hypothetical protein